MSKKIVVFSHNGICLRGTTVAMYDYADYNEKILGNTSIIAVSSYHKHIDDVVLLRIVYHCSVQ